MTERRFYHVLIRVAFLAVTAGSVFALFARQNWVAELFTHFRLYYLLIQALLALIFLHYGHRWLLLTTLAFALPNAWVVGPYLTPIIAGRSAAADAGDGIELVALNVNYRNDEYARVADYLRERDPDVIVIAEFTPAWRTQLGFLRESHPYWLGRARVDPWGLAVFSRLPFEEAELISLAKTDAVQARLVFSRGATKLEVFAVHLFSPTSPARAHHRNLQLEALAARVRASKYPAMVVGDMNLTPFSPYFSRFVSRSGLRDAGLADGFHVTWPVSILPVWIPIDHALFDPRTNRVRARTGPDVGSDHLPLEVVVLEEAGKRLRRDERVPEKSERLAVIS